MGMRATSVATCCSKNRFVADDAEVLPTGLFGAMYNAFPHLFVSFPRPSSGSWKRPMTVL
jgi:hypothetical protein